MKDLVKRTQKLSKDLKGKKVLDIGCNDGSLLNIFRSYGCKTYGVEPTNAAKEAMNKKHIIFQKYIDVKTSKQLIKKFKSFDIITFTNVFAHIENFSELIKALKILLNSETILVIENQYFGEVLKKPIDTFYHEYPRTYSLTFYKISKLLN